MTLTRPRRTSEKNYQIDPSSGGTTRRALALQLGAVLQAESDRVSRQTRINKTTMIRAAPVLTLISFVCRRQRPLLRVWVRAIALEAGCYG